MRLYAAALALALFSHTGCESQNRLIPEHERTLEQVLVHEQTYASSDLVERLPERTQILVWEAGDYAPPSHARDAAFMDSEIVPSVWAKDHFELVTRRSGPTAYLPKTIDSLGRTISSEPIKEPLERMGIRTVMTGLDFSGGDVLLDRCKGKEILFVGARAIGKNAQAHGGTKASKEAFKQAFSADETVEIPLAGNGPLSFIDQQFLITGRCEAVVPALDLREAQRFSAELSERISFLERKYNHRKIKTAEEFRERKELSHYHTSPWRNSVGPAIEQTVTALEKTNDLLAARGYRTHRLPMSLWDAFTGKAPVCGTPYREGDRQYMLLSSFTGTSAEENRKAQRFYESLKIEVIPIPDDAWRDRGSNDALLQALK